MPRLKRFLPCLGLLLLAGCNLTLMDPKGQVGVDIKGIILIATWLMLLVVVPVIILTIVFAWKYRASNTSATYDPDWSHSTKIEVVVWLIPCLIIIALGIITWRSSHELDPYKPLESNVKPITVEAVAMNWKWLFIYPELKIATINQLALPVNTPVNFKITSDSIMNSFFIPALGSQVYAMAGMETKLHLIANEAGTFDGMSANYSGGGFSGMKFKALAMSNYDFDAWVAKVRASSEQLGAEGYKALAKPSEAVAVTYYGKVDGDLYHGILHQYMDNSGRAVAREGFDGGPVCTSRNTIGDAQVSMTTPAKPAVGAQS
ncbi:ubiquinol oxidase subunit II [Cupriavidus plantarum]|uniref:Ubiquinol oxidase subunit 2 n=2 Tax=Cupriavidus plantarum TaxID=942865 RepID=A0A316F351_9BURK|nr:cytochrome bo3 quinol oxidase subunit 2 [Cupriavidus plantarum]CAG2127804.1 Cytochrome bo(3) ubiquinol oxidase subunit 2 [Cupriavidus plantarum]SMR67018.1 cytochrome bo3 quinol oxidase subunit 2 [Cupriavidus plantarum]